MKIKYDSHIGLPNWLQKSAKKSLIFAGLLGILLAVLFRYFFPNKINENLTISQVNFDIHYPRSIAREKTQSVDIKVRNLNNFSVRAGISFATEPTTGLYFLLPDSKRRQSDAIHWHDLDRLQPFSHLNIEVPFILEGDLPANTVSFSLRFTVIQKGVSPDSVVDFDMRVDK